MKAGEPAYMLKLLREMLVIDLNKIALWFTRNRRVMPAAGSMVCVNLGSGIHPAAGWINVDSAWYALAAGLPQPLMKVLYRVSVATGTMPFDTYEKKLRANRYIFHNLELSVPFADSTVDYAYSSHSLEHLPASRAEHLCREVLRALKPGGVFRVCVPDLKIACEKYLAGHADDAMIILFGSKDPSYYAAHKWMYDAASLSALLRDAGFVQIEEKAFREGTTPNLDLLDNYEGVTLRIEARKALR